MTTHDTTARDSIRVPIGLAFAMANQPMTAVDELLDEYEAVHRAEVLREAADIAVRAARGCGDSEMGQYAASVAASIGAQILRLAKGGAR